VYPRKSNSPSGALQIAEIVRSLFRRYLGAASVVRLKQQLDADGVRIPIRIDGAGRSTGGCLFSPPEYAVAEETMSICADFLVVDAVLRN
jgi:hypothetical protein